MTGSRLPDNRDIWRIAAPMILSNISVPLLGMVDTGVVGHLDSPVYLGAVAVGSTIFGFLYTGMNFLRMGTTGIAAQRYGARDNDGLRVSLGQAVIAASIIALFLLAVQVPLGRFAVTVVGGESSIQEHALHYFSIRIWSAPGTLANFALIGWFIGLQNARTPLIMFLTINVSNIVLDLVFVVGLGMTVDGVALASVIAEYLGLGVGLTAASASLRAHPGQWIVGKFTRFREYIAFFSVNTHLFVRTMALMFAFAFVTAQGARLGGIVLAANAVLMNLQNLAAFGLDGFAHAAEALVGKAVGENRRDVLERSNMLALRLALKFSAGICLAYIGLGPYLIAALTDLPEVRSTALTFLPWLVISPLISVWSFHYDGVFVGATRAREMRNIMLLSLVLFLIAWLVLQDFGNHGLWLAFMIFMASRGIGMHIEYRRKVLPMDN